MADSKSPLKTFNFGIPLTEVYSVLTCAATLKTLQRGEAPAAALEDVLSHTNHQPLIARALACVESVLAAKPEKYPEYQKVLTGACVNRLITAENFAKILGMAAQYAPYADSHRQYALAYVLKKHPLLPRELRTAAAALFDGASSDDKQTLGELKEELRLLPWAGTTIRPSRSPQSNLVKIVNAENCSKIFDDLSPYDTLRIEGELVSGGLDLSQAQTLPRVLDASASHNLKLHMTNQDLGNVDEIIFPPEADKIFLENCCRLPPRLIFGKKASDISFDKSDMDGVEVVQFPCFVYGNLSLEQLKNLSCPLDLSYVNAKQGIWLEKADFKKVPLFLPPQHGVLYMDNCQNLPETLDFSDCRLDMLRLSTSDGSLKRIILPREMQEANLVIGKDIDMMYYDPDAPDLRILRPQGDWGILDGRKENIDGTEYDKVELSDIGVMALFNIKNCPPFIDWTNHEEEVLSVNLCNVEQGQNSTVKFPLSTPYIHVIGEHFPDRTNIDKLEKLETLKIQAQMVWDNNELRFLSSLKQLEIADKCETLPEIVDLSAAKGLEKLDFPDNAAFATTFILPLEFKDKRPFPPNCIVIYAAPDNKLTLDLRHLGKRFENMDEFHISDKDHGGRYATFRQMGRFDEVLMPPLLRNIDFRKAGSLPRKIDFSQCRGLKEIENLNIAYLAPFPEEVIFPSHFRDNFWVKKCEDIGIKATVAPADTKGLFNYCRKKFLSR